jgi:uncharacterized lipoprotein
MKRFPKILLAAIAVAILGACTSSPRYKDGLQWVVENEQEKRRLNAAGFPQYNHD